MSCSFCLGKLSSQSLLIHMYEQIFKSCSHICTCMEKPEWTKTKGFRLPHRTLDQLDYLISEGGLRNATEAIIIAVDRLYMQEKFGTDVFERMDRTADFVAKHPDFIKRLFIDMDNPRKREEYERILREKIDLKMAENV